MTTTTPMLQTFKKKQSKSSSSTFLYQLYECVQLLAVNKNNHKISEQKGFQENVEILMSSFYERCGFSLLVLVCSNGHLLLVLREVEVKKPNVKQLNWFQNPSKKINALCIDPIRGAWVLCACADSSVYLIPVLEQMKGFPSSYASLSTSITASTTDLTRVQYARPLKGTPTCVVWWHTIDDQNIGIIGTKAGELVFLELGQRQEISRTFLKEEIVTLELLQDIHERTSYLFIQTHKNWTLQLLLEQPSQNIKFTSSLTQGYDMGYDMVTDCNVESILATDRSRESKEELNIQNRIEYLPQDFNYSIHYIRDNIWIAKHDTKFSALEVFSDIKRVPEFIYHVPQQTTHVVVCTNLMFTIFKARDKISMALLSRHLSTTAFGRQGLKKPDPTKRADLQTFELNSNTTSIVSCYKSQFTCPNSWQNQFPHSAGYEDECELNSFLIVTNDGVFECRPRVSPEHYFTELAVKDTEIADRLGITFDLNVPLLCEYIGDKIMESKDVPTALKFYHLSKCSPIKRAVKIIEYGTVTDALIYIKQVLKKPSLVLSSKAKKRLADMAITCYIEQVLETQQAGTFFKNLVESFRSFLCDNFDYDEDNAMELLASYGLIDNLFEVGKARGKIDQALNLLSRKGYFLLTLPIQNMLLDSGYADKVCKASEGAFIKHMEPEEQVRFLLADPEITRQFLNKLMVLLPLLKEAPLLLIARVFDPSRQFIKQFLEKSDLFRRKRTGSSLSIGSSNSTIVPEDPNVPFASEIILMFLKTLIELNSKRKWTNIPDMGLISRHLSGQFSWTGSLHKRSDSLGSNEMVKSEVAKLRIACGRHHSAFVSSENDLYTWGKASCGRLGHGDLMDENATSQPMRVESLHMHGIQVLSVSCGALHTVALCQEGVFSWGSNKYGQLGVGDRRRRSRPVLLSEISSKLINSVVCGHYHTLAITIDCQLYTWGWGIHGQLGLSAVENQVLPQHVVLLKDHRVIQAAAGYAHSAVLTSRGFVFTFGAGIYGQLGIGSNKKHTTPQLVDTLLEDSIYLIVCGSFETLAISEEQTIFCWGRNYHQFHICGKADNARYGRQMASNTTDINHRFFPEDLPFKLQQPITQLVCGNWHYIALTSVNCVYTWGCNDCGQLGHYNKIDQPAPRLVKALSRKCVQGVAAGSEFSMVMDTEEQVLAWGRADGCLIGIENEDSVHANPVARRSAFSVLAPTLVPGLPIHFDQVSIGSGHSSNREYLFDQHYDLPDLSSVGQGQPPYSTEAVLLSLFKLRGLYNADVIQEYAKHVKQWFVLSFCNELREEWDLAFTYRIQAIMEHTAIKDKEPTKHSICDQALLIVSDLLKKFEDFLTEDVQENVSVVAMVKCILRIFDYWEIEEFSYDRLEDLLRKHMELLTPVYAIVFFGYLTDVRNCINSNVVRISLYYAREQHTSCKRFSKFYFDDLLSNILTQLNSGTNWYTFLSYTDTSDVVDIGSRTESIAPIGESTLSPDDMVKEIVEHKRQLLNVKPFLTLSNAVATTLADASLAQKVSSNSYYQKNEHQGTPSIKLDEPDSTVFSCNHNFTRYYMLETVVPEFLSRMGELPEPLNHTAEVMARYYRQSDIKIPMACPYCVYNNLRSEQMNVLRETGGDLVNIKATVWEV